MNKKNLIVNDEFIIENYDEQKPFASFLPGIAGVKGIPLWCHYTNRSQAITSFGLRDKNGCILEFYPANTAYRIVDKMGFRTFLKEKGQVWEAFSIGKNSKVKRTMYTSGARVRIEEVDLVHQLKIRIAYFILPNENIGGLVRRVTITNLANKERHLEILDGITQLLPTDANEWMLKHQSNLLKSWMDVELLDGKIGFYYENSVPADTAEVNTSVHGNYYMSFVDGQLSKTIYDMNTIFLYDTSLSKPINFIKQSVEDIKASMQVSADKVSGGFSGAVIDLAPMGELHIDTVIGYASNREFILSKKDAFSKSGYFQTKEAEAVSIINSITKDIETKTNLPLFDQYMKQNYLDNILRGGIPYFIDTKSKHFVYHFFSIAPEYYSQGNGNFRDVCQNRRSDSLFHPEVGIFNVKFFANLIQLDGYNPLGVLGLKFHLITASGEGLVKKLFKEKNEHLIALLNSTFTPGAIVNLMEQEHLTSIVSEEELLKEIFEHAEYEICADFGEGYWVDHWTYLLDLVENFEAIYPELMKSALYEDNSYLYYDSPVTVLPRSEKYVLNKHGNVRQYGALLEKDEEKINTLHMNPWGSNWAKLKNSDEVIKTTLFGKLYSLALTKFSLLDPYGIGISMEANKPGWNDAMNGLPGIFASGVSETLELARLVRFLLKYAESSQKVPLPAELIKLGEEVAQKYAQNEDLFTRWNEVTYSIEKYRETTRMGVDSISSIDVKKIIPILKLMKQTLDASIDKALAMGQGIMPTFIAYEATKYERTGRIGHYGLEIVDVKEFKAKPLPAFLEAPARSMKYLSDKKVLQNQYQLIKQTALYDQNLHMYKTSVDLDNESFEIGRIRAFQKGWLERESNFLHMTYKYLLGLLKCGLYKEFYQEIKTNFTCFMDPAIYGRSVLENSSFIATSNNPDPFVHGEGFVARLSGSTAEALSMWHIMMFGKEVITLDKLGAKLNLHPLLTKDFIDSNNTFTTTLFSKIKVTYHLPKKMDTFHLNVLKYIVDGTETTEVRGDLLDEVRNGQVQTIKILSLFYVIKLFIIIIIR